MSVERLTLPRRSLRMSVNCGRFAASYDGAAGGGEQTFGVSQNVPHARGCYQSEDGNAPAKLASPVAPVSGSRCGSFTAFGGSWHYAYWSRGVPGYHLQTHPPAAAFRDCVCDALQRCIGLRHCCCSSLRMRGRRPPRPRVLSSIDIGPQLRSARAAIELSRERSARRQQHLGECKGPTLAVPAAGPPHRPQDADQDCGGQLVRWVTRTPPENSDQGTADT